MGFASVNNQNAVNKTTPLSQEIPQKESIVFGPDDISSKLTVSPQKNFFLDFFGASVQIAKNLLPASSAFEAVKFENKRKKTEFLQKENNKTHEFDIKFGNDLINGMVLFLDSAKKQDFKEGKTQDQKWIIHFNHSASFYETELAAMQVLGKDIQSNVLVFNYRGIGESRGMFSRIEDLMVDGSLCTRYLLAHGILEKNILVHGHALGGALGLNVAALYDKIGVMAAGCFSSLSKAASARVPLSGQFLAKFGWDLDALSAYEKIKAKKLIIYHKQDNVVPYKESSLYKALKEKIKSSPAAVEEKIDQGIVKNSLKAEYKPARVKLRHKFDFVTDAAHHYPLSKDPAYDEIIKFAKDFFYKKN